MRKIIVRAVAAGVCFALLVGLCGCRATPPASARAVLLAMCETLPTTAEDGATPLAHIALYTRACDPAAGEYLSDTLFSALYGEAARGLLSASAGAAANPSASVPSYAAISDAAICLSVTPSPTELAVFRCSDERGAATAAGLCRARLDALERAWTGSADEATVKRGLVTVVGSYVLLVVSPDPDRAVNAARRSIRQGEPPANVRASA